MIYADFYDIALHASINWNGKFTPKEIACYAYDYLCEFDTSKRNGEPTEVIKTLCNNLEMDAIGGDLDAKYWLENIKRELEDM